jgi:hypothetical protein
MTLPTPKRRSHDNASILSRCWRSSAPPNFSRESSKLMGSEIIVRHVVQTIVISTERGFASSTQYPEDGDTRTQPRASPAGRVTVRGLLRC